MDNPFLCSGDSAIYVSQTASLNLLKVAKLPPNDKQASAEGKTGVELLSAKRLIMDIREKAKPLKIDLSVTPNQKLPYLLFSILESGNDGTEKSAAAEDIVKSFGYRLGALLTVLKTGLLENRAARFEWNDEHWQYWAKIKNVIIVGGLTEGVFGKKLKRYAIEYMNSANIEPYNIVMFENAAYVGLMGCTAIVKEKTASNLIMDMGQTNIKRCIVKRINGELTEFSVMPTIPSRYMENSSSNEETEKTAIKLHKYLVNVIADSYNEASKKTMLDKEIVISIGNYVCDGVLNSKRGGYAKLSMLYKNYAECLSEELSGVLRRDINVTLVHDGTAVAMYFKEYDNSVCITLGTGIGVGFPDIYK